MKQPEERTYGAEWFYLHDLAVPTDELPVNTIRLVPKQSGGIFINQKLTIFLVRNRKARNQWTLEYGIQDLHHFIKWVNTRQVFYQDGPVYLKTEEGWTKLLLGLGFIRDTEHGPCHEAIVPDEWPPPTSKPRTAPTGD